VIVISSPVIQLAAIVAGSAAPAAAPAVADPRPPAAEPEAAAAPETVKADAPGDQSASAAAPPEPKAPVIAAEDNKASAAATTADSHPAPQPELLSHAPAERVASAFDVLEKVVQASGGLPSGRGGAQLELPLQYAMADTGQAEPAMAAPAADAAAAPAPEAAPAPAAAAAGTAAAPAADGEPVLNADEALIPGRRRPGLQKSLPERVTQENPGAVRPPPPEAFPEGSEFPIPDRWRLIKALCPDAGRFDGLAAVCHSRLDPYHQNFLKGDRPIDLSKKPSWLPIHGDDWFFTLGGVSDTVVEPRSFPTPNNRQDVKDANDVDVFGRDRSLVLSQTFIATAVLLKGSTAYQPPHVEYHVTLAYNINYVNVEEKRVLNVRPTAPTHRFDNFLGVQEAFIDYHIRNTSERYDFDSIRVGIQPFNADFRGFLFQDNQLGVRLFGDRDNNRLQYNLAFFWRLEKDTNSGLNDVAQTPRKDYVFVGNLFRQDFPFPGITSQVTAVYNMNRERGEVHLDTNGFPVRPVLLGNLETRNYDVVYLGYNMDGHIGRINMTNSFYGALGRDSNSFFTSKPADIRAFFAASELSYDINWIRVRLSGLYASGDHNAHDNKETGFDSIFENPIFAGADTSYWIRQSIPFAGGGRVISINQRNGILNDLRSSKDEGQSNFNNPGTMLLGVGADFDITPKFRLSANVNHLWFENTSSLRSLRNEGSIPKDIGFDYSLSAIYRPKMIQNVVLRLSGAVLQPGHGFRDLFTNSQHDSRYYSVLFNAILAY
jgi:hypothetical protein